jgi:hypothetical protein
MAERPQHERGFAFIAWMRRKLHGRGTKRENENPADRAARLTAKATVWIAAFTVIMALVGIGTLYEIVEGGSDTHDLAVAAGKQADLMNGVVTTLKDQADQTKSLVAQAVIQGDAAKKQVAALQAQLDVMRRNFTKEQQPFIWKTNADAIIQWNATTKQVLWTQHYTNYGKSPAWLVIERKLAVGRDALDQVKKFVGDPLPKDRNLFSKIPQSKVDYFTAGSDPVSKEDFDESMQHDNWIVLVGTYAYYDIAGHLYSTDFCDSRLSNGSILNCEYRRGRTPQ